MRQFIRFAVFIWAIAFALLSASSAKAEVYHVDIFGPAPDGIAVGGHSYASTNACSATTCAGGGFATAFYEFQPGDTVDFGSIRLGSSIFGDGRQMRYYGYPYNTAGYEVALYTGSLRVLYDYSSFIQLGTGFTASCTTADPACIPRLTSMLSYSEPIPLTFTLPTNATGIQLAFTTPYIYAAPAVPEPSTWAMLLIGFAGIGYAAYRRRVVADPA